MGSAAAKRIKNLSLGAVYTQLIQTRVFKMHIVIRIDIIQTNNSVALFDQYFSQVKPYKACGTCYEYGFVCLH